MEAHRLAEERSLAYHRAIAERLSREPDLLARARERVNEWLAREAGVPAYARRWAEVLARDADGIAAFLTQRNDLADELRQSSPFAGVLDARQRWRIWRETRSKLDGGR